MVDDDRDLRASLRRCLALDGGWRFTARPSGENALEKMSGDRPDVVLLDYDLGEGRMSGFEVLKRLRADARMAGVPVVMLTGALGEPVDAEVGLGLGADDFLVKPVAIPILLARLRAVITKAQRGARTS